MPPSPAGCRRQLQPQRTAAVCSLNNPALIVIVFSMVMLATSCALPAQGNSSTSSATKTSSSEPSKNPEGGGGHLTVSGAMPAATVGAAFNAVVSVSGGQAPYQFGVAWQSLPPGMTVNATSGRISGTPSLAGTYLFSISATDPKHDYGDHRFTISVSSPISTVKVSVSPASASVLSGATQQFTATVTGTSNTAVTWSASAGTISGSGLFTAPTVTVQQTVTVAATSVVDPKATAGAVVDVTSGGPPPPPPPPPTGADNRYCNVGNVPNFSGNDGPAQMPQSCLYTALSGTPAPGKVTTLASGGDLKGALNSASCGDTIQLAAGGVYDYSKIGLAFPAKGCDDQHWIIVRTSTPDAQLPPEGSRLTPCWAGVASLPGRPAYPCPAGGVSKLTAQILLSGSNTLSFSGADHYRFIGVEVTRTSGTGVTYNLVTTRGGSKLIFDRVWLHGSATDETTRGVAFSDGNEVAVIDSYLNDFHCISVTGACTDAQAISGGCNTSTGSSNTFKVVDNFLEAAAENILFGGCTSTHTSGDIEIRRNHFFKPTTWDPSDPNYIGIPFIVKNNLELKDAERVLVEGNMLDSTWGGFSQVGFTILLTPKNPNGGDPGAHVSDITVRYLQAQHSGAAIGISAGLDDSGHSSLGIWNVSVHDAIFDDVSNTCYQCTGNAIQITRGDPNASSHDLVIDHITLPRTTNLNALFIAGSQTPAWQNVTVSNSILATGTYQAVGTGTGSSDCSNGWDPQNPTKVMNACWTPYALSTNVMLSGFGTWPTNNWSDTPTGVQFVNYNNGVGGNYQLAASSPYLNKGSDGKDVGADVSQILTQTLGVQ